MTLIILLDLIVIVSLVWVGRRRLEDALPLFSAIIVLFPIDSKLVLPGLFDVSTERVALITLLGMFVTQRQKRTHVPIPLIGLMLLHFGWMICSTLVSLSVITSVKQVLAQVVEYYLLYYLFLRVISSGKTAYRIIYAIVLALGICCVFSLLEAYQSWSILRIFPAENWTTYDSRQDPLYLEIGRGMRLRSTFPHPILFGDALSMGITLTIFLLGSWKRGAQRTILWVILALMCWTIYKTASRGPWLAAGASAVLLLFMIPRVKRYVVLGLALVPIVFIVRPGVWESVSSLYSSTLDPNSLAGASYQFRHDLNDAVISAVAQSPKRMVLGYGLGTFRELGLDIEHRGEIHHWITCDNHWILFLYETGYVGFALIVTLLFRALYLVLKDYLRLPRAARTFSGVLFITIAAYYFLLLSVAGYNWGQQGFMAWILIAVALAYPRCAREESDSDLAPRASRPRWFGEDVRPWAEEEPVAFGWKVSEV
jgi:O-antigen ligase